MRRALGSATINRSEPATRSVLMMRPGTRLVEQSEAVMFDIAVAKTASVCALAAVLFSIAGCVDRGIVPATLEASVVQQQGPSNAPELEREQFNANYSGRYKSEGVTCRNGTRTGYGWKFRGRGKATTLGRGTQVGFYINCPAGSSKWSGPATLTSNATPANAAQATTLDLKLIFSSSNSPCGETGAWNVAGGTGQFKGAKGDGNVGVTCSSTGTVKFSFSGHVTANAPFSLRNSL